MATHGAERSASLTGRFTPDTHWTPEWLVTGGVLGSNLQQRKGLALASIVVIICTTCFNRDNSIQNYQRDALNIIYSSNIITLLYMFRVPSTHLQEDIRSCTQAAYGTVTL